MKTCLQKTLCAVKLTSSDDRPMLASQPSTTYSMPRDIWEQRIYIYIYNGGYIAGGEGKVACPL